MTITPIMLYCQEQILKRLYPDMSLDDIVIKHTDLIRDKKKKKFFYHEQGILSGNVYTYYVDDPIEYIEGASLSRVLTALGDYSYNEGKIIDLGYHPSSKKHIICDRTLLNEDKTDATLFDQSIETQEAIGKLLGYNDL